MTRTGDAMAVRAVERRRDAKERGRQRAAKRNDERNERGGLGVSVTAIMNSIVYAS